MAKNPSIVNKSMSGPIPSPVVSSCREPVYLSDVSGLLTFLRTTGSVPARKPNSRSNPGHEIRCHRKPLGRGLYQFFFRVAPSTTPNQCQVSDQTLQTAIPLLKLLEPAGVRDLHTTEPGFPAIQRLFGNPIVTATSLACCPGFNFSKKGSHKKLHKRKKNCTKVLTLKSCDR